MISKHKTIKLYTDSKQPLEAVTWYKKSVSMLSVDEMKEVPEKTEKHCRVLKEVWWEGLEWIFVLHDRDKFYAVVSMVMSLQIPSSTENFWTRQGTNKKNSSLGLLWRKVFFSLPTFAYVYNSFFLFCYGIYFVRT